jgi:hypothetical protein
MTHNTVLACSILSSRGVKRRRDLPLGQDPRHDLPYHYRDIPALNRARNDT